MLPRPLGTGSALRPGNFVQNRHAVLVRAAAAAAALFVLVLLRPATGVALLAELIEGKQREREGG